MITPIILAGGVGKRLWPISVEHHPKQVLKLVNNLTMLQMTFNHLQFIKASSHPIIICNEKYRFTVAEQLREVNKQASIIIEKKVCNTAFAVTVSTLYAMTETDDPLILVLPSDLYIPDAKTYANMIQQATGAANLGKLVIFGIVPKFANTDFGYIKKGEKSEDEKTYVVENFFEKPSAERAEVFFRSGDYYWNGGMFLFKASSLIQELKKYSPLILSLAEQALKVAEMSTDFIYLDDKSMQNCPNIPLDKAVFEHTDQAVVMPFEGDWSDLGDWQALYKIGDKDQDSNVVHGQVLHFDTLNSYLYSTQPLLVTSGISDCLVVATPEAILVACLDKKQDIKKIVDQLLNKKA